MFLRFLSSCLLLFLFVSCGNVVEVQDEAARKAFDEKYAEWLILREKEAYRSDIPGMKVVYEIAELGPPVLPFIVEKMEHNLGDFHLEFAFYLITRKRYEHDEYPNEKVGDAHTIARMAVRWWKHGRWKTENRFQRYRNEWKQQKAEGRLDEADATLMRIRRMGIIAVPFMIDRIKAGEKEFIPLVVFLTEGRQREEDSLPDNPDPAACIAWWEASRARLEIPTGE